MIKLENISRDKVKIELSDTIEDSIFEVSLILKRISLATYNHYKELFDNYDDAEYKVMDALNSALSLISIENLK